MEGKNNWRGSSGMVYEFEVWNIGTKNFNPIPCNYILAVWNNPGWSVVHVGQTGDLKSRIAQHQVDPSHSHATHVHVLHDDSVSSRLAVESDLGGR